MYDLFRLLLWTASLLGINKRADGAVNGHKAGDIIIDGENVVYSGILFISYEECAGFKIFPFDVRVR